MLYERLWKWLTFDKRRNCGHEWVKVGYSTDLISYNLYYYDHFKFSECGKKKKSLDTKRSNLGSNYIHW